MNTNTVMLVYPVYLTNLTPVISWSYCAELFAFSKYFWHLYSLTRDWQWAMHRLISDILLIKNLFYILEHSIIKVSLPCTSWNISLNGVITLWMHWFCRIKLKWLVWFADKVFKIISVKKLMNIHLQQ